MRTGPVDRQRQLDARQARRARRARARAARRQTRAGVWRAASPYLLPGIACAAFTAAGFCTALLWGLGGGLVAGFAVLGLVAVWLTAVYGEHPPAPPRP